MWALVESGSVTNIYTRPKQLTIGDIKYPSNIFTLWSASELESLGIYLVIIDNSNYKNPEYYVNTNQSFTFADNKVTATYGTATAKPLDNVLWQDGDSDMPEGTSVGDIKQSGVRPPKLVIVDQQAYGLLQPNDWMVVKATETGGSVASDWTTYRAAVRTTANDMKTKINAASTIDELAALYEYNNAEPPVRPLGKFPTPPTS